MTELTQDIETFVEERNPEGERPPPGFISEYAETNGLRMHYVRGGAGPTLVLVHGYPQSWYEWRKVMPELAHHYTVIAVDLRGSGESEVTETGYDKKTLAADIHGLLASLGLDREVRIVGHDIGLMVAYAFASAYSDQVKALVLLDALIPDESLYSFPSLTAAGPGNWHFGFYNEPNSLAEKLVSGNEEAYLDWRFRGGKTEEGTFTDRDVAEYLRSLKRPENLRASFEYFRAFRQDVADNANRPLLEMPVLAIGAEFNGGSFLVEQVRRYAKDVVGEVIVGDHWIPEENPDYLVQRLLHFFFNPEALV